MPIRIQNDLPAKEILEKENIFVMDESRALSQEIRPLKVGILNLMIQSFSFSEVFPIHHCRWM